MDPKDYQMKIQKPLSFEEWKGNLAPQFSDETMKSMERLHNIDYKKEFEEIVKSKNLSFIDQVNLFSNLNCIITLHGAGLSNLVFCKKNTKVIEIRTSNNSDIFPKVLSKLCNLK